MRTRMQLKETFNKTPRPEGIIQNQYLLLEVLMDIRDLLYGKREETRREYSPFLEPIKIDSNKKTKVSKPINEPI